MPTGGVHGTGKTARAAQVEIDAIQAGVSNGIAASALTQQHYHSNDDRRQVFKIIYWPPPQIMYCHIVCDDSGQLNSASGV
jgi:hypothetical protein